MSWRIFLELVSKILPYRLAVMEQAGGENDCLVSSTTDAVDVNRASDGVFVKKEPTQQPSDIDEYKEEKPPLLNTDAGMVADNANVVVKKEAGIDISALDTPEKRSQLGYPPAPHDEEIDCNVNYNSEIPATSGPSTSHIVPETSAGSSLNGKRRLRDIDDIESSGSEYEPSGNDMLSDDSSQSSWSHDDGAGPSKKRRRGKRFKSKLKPAIPASTNYKYRTRIDSNSDGIFSEYKSWFYQPRLLLNDLFTEEEKVAAGLTVTELPKTPPPTIRRKPGPKSKTQKPNTTKANNRMQAPNPALPPIPDDLEKRDNGNIKCPKCEVSTLTSPLVYSIHMKQHGAPKKFLCRYCDFSHVNSQHVAYHMETSHTSIDIPKDTKPINRYDEPAHATPGPTSTSKSSSTDSNKKSTNSKEGTTKPSPNTAAKTSTSTRKASTPTNSTSKTTAKPATTSASNKSSPAKSQSNSNPSKPSTTKPATAKPSTAKPSTTKPSTTKPSTATSPELQQTDRVNTQCSLNENLPKNTIRCPKCDVKTLTSPLVYKMHFKQHGVTKQYVCTLCDFSHTNPQHVSYHMETSHDDIKPGTKCVPVDRYNGEEQNGYPTAASIRKDTMKSESGGKNEDNKPDSDKPDSDKPDSDKPPSETPTQSGGLLNPEDIAAGDAVERTTTKCEKCSYTGEPREIEEHELTIHTDVMDEIEGDFCCPFCVFRGKSEVSIRNHMEENHKRFMAMRSEFCCTECEFSVGRDGVFSLINHRMRHMDRKRFKCRLCSYSSKFSSVIESHLKHHHSAVRVAPSTSDKKDETAAAETAAAENSAADTSIDGKTASSATASPAKGPVTRSAPSLLKCQHCTYVSRLQITMNKHIQRKHGSSGDGPANPTAGEPSENRKSSRATRVERTPSPQETTPRSSAIYEPEPEKTVLKYQCSVTNCNYRAKVDINLLAHMKGHSPSWEKRYECSVCGWSNSGPQHVRQHIVNLHASKGSLVDKHNDTILPLALDINRASLVEEKRGPGRPRVRPLSEEQPYPCPKCDYKATNRGRLTNHLKRHVPGQAYTCKYCDYGSEVAGTVSMHEASAHVPPPPPAKPRGRPPNKTAREYKCVVCPFTTTDTFKFSVHQKRHK